MRGKAQDGGWLLGRPGITPAYAGKSHDDAVVCGLWGDHPRVCGEKLRCTFVVSRFLGSPPRMRGKEKECEIMDNIKGITPAYAGKSYTLMYAWNTPQDHPRVCGEKTASVSVQ